MLATVAAMSLIAGQSSGQAANQVVDGAAPDQPVGNAHGARLAPADRQILASDPDGRVQVLLASDVGRGREVMDLVRSVGGSVWRSSDRAGFVIARMTAAGVARIEGSPQLTAIALDRRLIMPADAAESAAKAAASDTTTAASKETTPYSPIGDVGAPKFIGRHPTWDGRGVAIGVVDTGVDPTAPGLQTTSTGQQKVIKAYNFMDGMRDVVTSQDARVEGGKVAWAGRTYTAPPDLPDGDVRMGELREDGISSSPQDLNRDGDTDDAFSAVVAGTTRQDLTIWFDTDQDGSFADEDGLQDWNSTYQTTRLGLDDPATRHVEEFTSFGVNLCQVEGTLPCVTRAPRLGDVWDFVTDLSPHGTPSASIAAGNDMRAFGESFDGGAPGAQVISLAAGINRGPFDYAAVASQVAAAFLVGAEAGVDVLACGFAINQRRGGAASQALSQLVDNLIAAYGISVSVAAGNGAHLASTYFAPLPTRRTISVGGMITPTTFERSLLRSGIPGEMLRWYSSSGPLPDGGYHPDVLAPSEILTGYPTWKAETGLPGYPVEQMPAGYRVFSGTSASHPVIAGALADLISAAKQRHVRFTAHTLKRALELSGRPLQTTGDDYQVVDIGHGLVRLDEAWGWLERLGADGAIDRDVDTQTYNEFFGEGEGIYQRNYFDPSVPVTLYTNTDKTHTYKLRASEPWIGLSRTRVRLPGNGGVELTVSLDPSLTDRPGVHSGVITIDDPTTVDPADHEMMVVVTPTPLDKTNQLHVSGDGPTGIDPGRIRRYFITVPSGATSLKLQSTTASGAPAGVDVRALTPGPDLQEQIALIAEPQPGQTGIATIANPKPGVWELWLHANEDNRVGQPVVPRHAYDVTVTIAGPEP
jgi:subtilase family protein